MARTPTSYDWTCAEAVAYLASRTDAQLSRRLDLVRFQQASAFTQRNEAALGSLQRQEDAIIRARLGPLITVVKHEHRDNFSLHQEHLDPR